jgi:precorrin-6Y C5,15-methyltransferase (decarboxylating)
VNDKVWVIGISAGGADSLPPALREHIVKADVLAGGERHLGYFPDFAGRFAIRWTLGSRRWRRRQMQVDKSLS